MASLRSTFLLFCTLGIACGGEPSASPPQPMTAVSGQGASGTGAQVSAGAGRGAAGAGMAGRGSTAVGPDAGAAGTVSVRPDAGTSPPEDDAGETSDADSGPSTPAAAADAALDADVMNDAGPTPPTTDYGARGPHEVVIEKNVGLGFRNYVADDTRTCRLFISAAGGSNSEVDEELTSYPADMDRGLYTMFRPARFEEGQKYPVITWGNGTCSHPLLFQELLEHLASHGFIVIATNSRWVSGGVEMLRAVEFILSENENAESELFGKIDPAMIGASGHSQGSLATVTIGADRRIAATVPIQGASAGAVADLRGPTFLIAGELDTLVTPSSIEQAFAAATVPAVYGLSLGQDHLMPGLDPKPILDAVTAWLKIHLAKETPARDLFYGAACKLCSDPRWKIERKNL